MSSVVESADLSSQFGVRCQADAAWERDDAFVLPRQHRCIVIRSLGVLTAITVALSEAETLLEFVASVA